MTFSEFTDQAKSIAQGIRMSFDDPQRLHAIAVHLPIVLAVVGFVWVLAMMLSGAKSHKLRFTGVALLFLAGVGAWLGHESGENARANFAYGDLSQAATEVLDQHAQLGEYLWIGFIATSLLLLLSAVRAKGIRWIAMVLALLTSLVSVGWVSATAHLGGELVYVYGVGVPASEDNISHHRNPLPNLPDSDKPDKSDQPEGDKAVEITWDEFLDAAKAKGFVGEVYITGKAVAGELKADYADKPDDLKPPYRVYANIGDETIEEITNQLLGANQPYKKDSGKSGFFGIPTE